MPALRLRSKIGTIAILVLLCGIGGANAAFANVRVYICNFQTDSRQILPPQVVIAHDVRAGRVVISDPMTVRFTGGPIDGRVLSRDNQQVAFGWRFRAITPFGGAANLNFRAQYSRSQRQMILQSEAEGTGRRDQSRGSCVIQQRDRL